MIRLVLRRKVASNKKDGVDKGYHLFLLIRWMRGGISSVSLTINNSFRRIEIQYSYFTRLYFPFSSFCAQLSWLLIVQRRSARR